MAVLTFRGGIHLYGGKEPAMDKPIVPYLPKGDLVYPLSQHTGTPAVPVVEPGDRVLAGQKIAKADGNVSSPVHASVSGIVKAIEPRLTADGTKVGAIVVENDGLYEEAPGLLIRPFDEMTKSDILDVIRESGIVGPGGDGFPAHVRLAPEEPDKIRVVLVNCIESEPYLTGDYRIMMERPRKVVGGLKVILELFDHARGYICIEDNKPEAITVMQKACEGERRIEIKVLKTKYPQGAERMLIHAVTGKDLNSSMLPARMGCIADNCGTVAAVYDAVILGRPMISRIVTISGDAAVNPKNIECRTGTNAAELVKAAGGFKKGVGRIIFGGPMTGIAVLNPNVPVTKTITAVTGLLQDDTGESRTARCINCGRCAGVCCEGLIPARLFQFAQKQDLASFEKWGGAECIECGCCSYICPAKIPLVQAIKDAKHAVFANCEG